MRSVVARLLTLLGVLLLAGGLLAGVANREVLDGDRFAEHVDGIRSDPEVAHILGVGISDQLITHQPELVSLRPLLESAATTVVASDALGPVVRSTVAPLHRALVSGDGDQVLLYVADVGVVLLAALRALDPDTSVSLPDNLEVTLADFGTQNLSRQLIDTAHLVSTLAWLLPILGVLALVLSWLAGRHCHGGRSVLDHVQRAFFWVATTVALGTFIGSLIFHQLRSTGSFGAVLAACLDELAPALWRSVGFVVVVALALAVVTLPGFRLTPRGMVEALAAWYHLDRPTIRTQVTRGLAMLVAAVGIMLEPLTAVTLALSGVALLAVVRACHEIAAGSARWLDLHLPRLARTVRRRFTPGLALTACGVLLCGLIVVGAWPQNATVPVSASSSRACNGHIELCERRYSDVSFVATHNSMSAAGANGFDSCHCVFCSCNRGTAAGRQPWSGWEMSRSQPDGTPPVTRACLAGANIGRRSCPPSSRPACGRHTSGTAHDAARMTS